MFKEDQLLENSVVSVQFPGLAHDGRSFFALFTNGPHSGPGPTRVVFEDHYLKWLDFICRQRTGSTDPVVRCIFQDRDPVQFQVLQDLREQIDERKLRVRMFTVCAC